MKRIKDFIGFTLLCTLLLHYQDLRAQDGFEVDISSGCAPIIVNFTYTEGGDPTFLSWDFGNANTLSGDPAVDPIILSPSISYTEAGSYTVSLIVTNSSGDITYTNIDFITVYEDPTANFSSDITEGCGSFPVSFTDLSIAGGDPISEWNWDFGDGGSSSEQNPIHTYNAIGVYDVSLSVTSINGCSNTYSINNLITAIDGVYPEFELSDTISCTLPTSVSFTNLSSGAGNLQYSWDFGNGNGSILENPLDESYTDFGEYEVILTVSNDLACTQSFTQVINIQEFQVAFLEDINCIPSPSYFFNQSDSEMNEFEWNFGDPSSGPDNTSSEEDPMHEFSTPGSYTITLTASINGECENSFSQTINVLETEAVDYTIEQSFICEFPSSIPITINNSGVELFNWYIINIEGDTTLTGNQSSTTIDIIDPISDGYYDISINVSFDNGCISNVYSEDFFNVDLIQQSNSISPVNICEGETVYGVDLTTYSSGIASYEWDWGDGNLSFESSGENTYDEAGDYYVSLLLTSPEGCTADTTVLVQVGIPSDPSFSYPDTTICIEEGVPFIYTGDTSLVDQYIWLYDWFLASNDQSPDISILEIDSLHTISLITINNGCPDTLTQMVNIVALGPKAIFTVDQELFCKEEAPFISTISNNSEVTDNTSYLWTFGVDYIDSSFVDDPGSIEYIDPGMYTITLTLSDSINECEHQQIQEIYIDNFSIYFEDSTEHACDSYTYTGEMRFTDALPITPGSLFYNWDFGNGESDISNPPDSAIVEVNYTSTGSYLMIVDASNEYGCSDTASQWAYVHPSPIADFSMENPHQCPPYNVNVTNLSVEMDTIITEYEYILNLDSNIYYYDENPVLSILQSGTHLLSLIITDGFGCGSLTSQVLNPYNITIDYTIPPFLCYDTEYVIETAFESDFPPIQYQWDFGDGSFSVDSFPSVSIDNQQSDTLLNTITLIDSTGCTVVDSFYIYISVPDINYSFQIEDAACPPMYSDFSIFSSDSIVNYSIDYGDGESNSFVLAEDAANISHVYDLPGNYDVEFMVTDIYGCTNTIDIDSLILIPGPWAEFSFSPNSGCPPLEVDFEILSGNNADEYFWVFGDGNTSNLENPTHIYNLQGIYTPVLVLQDSANSANGDTIPCIISVQQSDIIIDGPILDFDILEDSLCPGVPNSLQIINNTTSIPGFEISSYLWNYGDGGFSLDEDPEPYSYDQAGLYSIILTVTTTNGCEYILEQSDAVNVIAAPEIGPTFDYEPSCPPMLVNFYGDPDVFSDPEIHFLWSFGDGNYSEELNPTHTYNSEGIYNVNIAIEYLGCDYEIPLNGTIETLPVPEAAIGSTPVFNNNMITDINLENQSIEASEIEWWINGNMLSTEDNITLPFSNQNLQIFLIAKNDDLCMDTTYLAYDDIEWNISNVLTPNGDGINDLFILNFGEFGTCIGLSVYNRWGSMVYENPNYRNTWTGRNMKGDILSDGTYFYIINICSKAKIEGYITIMH